MKGSAFVADRDTEHLLTPDVSSDCAAALLSQRQLGAIKANLPGTLADSDPEFLHDLRVAVRRTRSLQRELKTVFPPAQLDHFRQEFRWLQQVTGPTRDLDVYLLDFADFAAGVTHEQRNHLDVLRTLLEEHRATEWARMAEALRSERTERLLGDWAAFLDRLPDLPVGDRTNAAMPVGELAARR